MSFHHLRAKFKTFIEKNQRLVMPLVLFGGFVADWFTLNRIDQVFDNIIFIIHLVLSGGAIYFLHATDEEYLRFDDKKELYRRRATLLMLFSFGALYSGFFIFYLRSASFVASWFVVIGLLIMMLSTELKQEYFNYRTVQITVYYTALFLYAIFVVPIVYNKISAGVFVMSGIVSIIAVLVFLYGLWWIDREGVEIRKPGIIAGIATVFIMTNFLYFMNVIPPIPLSLQDKAPYLLINKQNNNEGVLEYQAVYEQAPWYHVFSKKSRTIVWGEGRSVYAFASVFAPTDIRTEIRHCWEWFDENKRTWKQANCVPINITGGRDGGYRGFSKKTNVWPGKWRVKFITKRNQILGILRFRIVEGEIDPEKVKVEIL